jgi:hypothetical protein
MYRAQSPKGGSMKRKVVLNLAVLALVVGAIVGIRVLAADLNPSHIGSSCESGPGVWHFVNNQTDGAAAGSLTAVFADAGSITVPASTVSRNNQHFYINGPAGPLVSASTNLPGRLVLSDLDCPAPSPSPSPSPSPDPSPTPDPSASPTS